MSITIARFDTACMRAGSVGLCVGDKCTGKSTMLRHLARCLEARAHAQKVVAMSPLPSSRRALADYCHPMCVHDMCHDTLRRVVSRVQSMAAAGAPPHTVVILDDVTDDVLGWDAVRDLLTMGRALNITVLMAGQHRLRAVKPDIRANVDFVFAFAHRSQASRRRVHAYFADAMPFPAFEKALTACTRDHECLVANAALGQVQYCMAQDNADDFNMLSRTQSAMLGFGARIDARTEAMAQLKALTPQEVGLWFSVAAEHGHVGALQKLAQWHTVGADQVAAAAVLAAGKGRVAVLRYMIDTFGAMALDVPQAYAAALLVGQQGTAQFLLDALRLTAEDILPVVQPPPRVACHDWQAVLTRVRALS